MKEQSIRHTSLSIRNVLSLVDSGALALPDFQRPFEWGVQQVRSLVATIIMGWPAGSLLLMEAPPTQFFAVRPIEGAPNVDAGEVRHLVLDGQQRITSVFQAFTRTPMAGQAWYLDLDKWSPSSDVDSLESALFQTGPTEYSPYILPLSILGSDRLFVEWRERALSNLDDSLAVDNYNRINDVWQTCLARVKEYTFSCEVLERDMPLSSVSRIFERLNTSGMTLGTFDLVTAHVYRDGHNLRAVWDALILARPGLAAFASTDAQIAVEIVALKSRGDTRRESLLALDGEELWSAWPSAIAGLEAAAGWLASEVSIAGAAQLPHRAIFLILAALGSEYDLQEHAVTLRHWVFVSALTSRFDAAVNTRVVRDYRLLKEALEAHSAVPDLSLGADRMAQMTKRGSSSAWLGLQALLRWNGAKDLPIDLFAGTFAGQSSTPISVARQTDSRVRGSDSVMGMVLGSSTSSSLLERRGARVFARILDQIGDPDSVVEYCDSQLLPLPGDSAYESDGSFVARRAEVVARRISGLASMTALEAARYRGREADEADLLTEIASSRLSLGDSDAAVAALRSVLRLRALQSQGSPPAAQDVVNLASALSIAGQHREAIEVLLEGIHHRDRIGDRSTERLVLIDAAIQEYFRVGEVEACAPLAQALFEGACLAFGPASSVAHRSAATLVVVDLSRGEFDAASHRWAMLSELVGSSLGPWRLGDYAVQVFDGLVELGQLDAARRFRDSAPLSGVGADDPSATRFEQRSSTV